MSGKLKLIYQVYNFFNKRYLKHNLPLYKKYGLNKKYYSSISSEDFKEIGEELNIYDIKDSSLFLKEDENFLALDKKNQDAILHWSDKGYAILEGFFSEEEVEAINKEIVKLEEEGKNKA